MSLTQVQGGMILPSTTLTTPIVATTMGVGGATPAASGSGITFPASQSASTDANTLDDYEEGTWTPTAISGYTSPVYGSQLGRYTKIGRICYFNIWLAITSGTRTGSLLQITLPFTSTSAGFTGGAYWAYASGAVVNSTTTNLPTLYIGGSTDRMNFYFSDGNNFNGTNLSLANPDFYITGWMECA